MKEERTTGTKSQTRRSTSGTRSTSAVHNTKDSSVARSAQAAGDRRSTGRRNAAHRRKRKRRLIRRYVTLFSVLIIFASVIFFTAAAMRNASPIDIVLKAAKLEMKQEQEIPSLTAEVQVGGKKEKVLKKVLDRKHNYTVADFVEELESGKGYEVVCKADGTVEGEFDIKINLTEDMKKKLQRKYMKRVNVSVKEGKLVVQNKYGTWEEDKFKLYDGTYVKSNFMQSKGSTYYFGEDEKKVIGWQEIESYKYYFDEEGKMLTGWQKIEDATYYLGEDGKAHVSWLELDGNKYCFDKDGKMLTGEQQVGIKKCVFAEDGKLESEESSIDPSKPMVALTFDDGPGKRTMHLLEAFPEHGARGTFFMV
ncbi:MAG: polysaccharide deacetylase family protein [Lachnospiraceae bacterium]|nr:polysaccharide deacetylase family protein [Lachnospiraceae bacterium]